MPVSDLRLNPLTGRWVAIAPSRGQRPDDFRSEVGTAGRRPVHDPDCPFCPGQEDMLPAILEQRSIKGTSDWSVRAVPNKYPAFSGDADFVVSSAGPYRSAPAPGWHEVIIDTRRHDLDLADLDPPRLKLALATYRDRFARLMAEAGIEWAMLFRNHGEAAGTSLEHSHSQLVGTPWVPAEIRSRAALAQQHYERTGRCLVCDVVEYELAEHRRLLSTAMDFVAIVPYCASAPFEIWLIPRRHTPGLDDTQDDELQDLADGLGSALRSMRQVTGSAPYNLILHSMPPSLTETAASHWLLRILPRQTTFAGLELGSGVLVNTSSPELDAHQLQEAWSALK